MTISPPFPWFGGKSRIAKAVWQRLGPVNNYVEPFFGSGAVLLARPAPITGTETINDLDGFVCNFWRAVSADHASVAEHADWPLNEIDVQARHRWLIEKREELTMCLVRNPDFYDAKIAGRWAWRICAENLANWHKGTCYMPTGFHYGQGVVAMRYHDTLRENLQRLSARLKLVRVFCSDWHRILDNHVAPSTITPVGIFLDPLYAKERRSDGIYTCDEEGTSEAVRLWALSHGDDRRLRIALCGYVREHEMPGWASMAWSTIRGFSSLRDMPSRGKKNARSEIVWFSPHCPGVHQGTFGDVDPGFDEVTQA